MRRIFCVLLVLGVMFVMSGCTKGDKVKKTTLYIEEDGKLTEAIVEALDKKYYDAGEMEDWIDEEVKAYNKEHGSAVDLKKCEVDGKEAKVTFEYKSMVDYSEFNNVKAFCGTIAQAEKAGYGFEGEFISTKDKPSITHMELEGSKKYKVVILEDSQKVVLENDILYASPNVKVDGKKATVEASTNDLAYIIYK